VSPTISIIIPAYNAEQFLAATLNSVLAQTVSEWELLIIDDGSHDSTRMISEKYAARDPRIQVWTKANAGVSAARNFGYARSNPNSEFLCFLDADDVWEPKALEILRQALTAHPEAPAAYGLARYIDKAGAALEPGVCESHQRTRWGIEDGRVTRWPDDRPTDFTVEAVMERIVTSGTVLIRRHTLEISGLFDPSLRLWEDWDLWLRISRIGGLIFVNKLVLGYRQHGGNVSAQLDALEAGEWHVRYKLLASLHDDPHHLKIARLGLQYRHRNEVKQRLRSVPGLCRQRRIGSATRQTLSALKSGAAYFGVQLPSKRQPPR
jgi:glycosyltransferase involved in cell wall biosynthesis